MQGSQDGGPGGRQGPSGQQFEPAHSKGLYVGNLHNSVHEGMLQEIFCQLGQVVDVKVIRDKATGVSLGYGFVKFFNQEHAQAALHALNGRTIYGQELRVNWAFQREKIEEVGPHFQIFVGDLSPEVNERILLEAFQHVCTGCADARVMWDSATGRSKGYGFMTFRSKEDAQHAIQTMNGEFIGSRRVRCGWAQHKESDAVDPDTISKMDPRNSNVYIGNLSPDVTEQDLREHFERFGHLKAEPKVYRKGAYGFVEFSTHESAVSAIYEMQHYELKGKHLKVHWGRHHNRGPTQVQQGIQQQHPMLGIPSMAPPMYGQQYLNPAQFQQPQFVPRGIMPPQGAIQPPGGHHPGLHSQQQQQQLQQQQPQGPNNLTLEGMGYYTHMYYPSGPGQQ